MKKYIKATSDDNILYIDIDVNFALAVSNDIAATIVLPLKDDSGRIDDQAWADYQSFVWTVFEILDLYGFVERPGSKDNGGERGSKTKTIRDPRSEFSYYFWAAHQSQIDAENVPHWLRVRISNHTQDHIDANLYAKQQEDNKEFLEKNKLPKNKQRQRYLPKNIVVNGDSYDTYEEALNAIERDIYKWMIKEHIDVSNYDKPDGSW